MPQIPVHSNTRKSLPLLSHSEQRLNDLITFVQRCQACPAMDGRKRVLSNKNGNVGAKVMFVAEAPGRNGADRTGIPLHGDPSGNLFERLLESVDWLREDVYVTNAVLCNPRDADDNNRTPDEREVKNCSFNLQSTVAVVDPAVVATMGQVPLVSLGLIEKHGIVLKEDVAKPIPWYDRIVFPLYHPSPRAAMHRSFDRMLEDFQELKKLVLALPPWSVHAISTKT